MSQIKIKIKNKIELKVSFQIKKKNLIKYI